MALFFLALYALQRLQAVLPFNPQHLDAVGPDLAFNTSVSFVTNTNWQSYTPETTMSYLTQMAGLAVHNFVSAATGIALAIALIRGFARRSARTIGNFWVDMTRTVLYVLLPIAIVVGLFFVWQGTSLQGLSHAGVARSRRCGVSLTCKEICYVLYLATRQSARL
jgi:potassium-transporting ATPase potassium-binding subunit